MVPWNQRPKISDARECVRKPDQNNRIRLALRLPTLSTRVCAVPRPQSPKASLSVAGRATFAAFFSLGAIITVGGGADNGETLCELDDGRGVRCYGDLLQCCNAIHFQSRSGVLIVRRHLSICTRM